MESIDNFFFFWKIPVKRLQLKYLGLEQYYNSYLQKLYQSYLNTFALVQILTNIVHLILTCILVKRGTFIYIGLDILSIILTLVALYLMHENDWHERKFAILISSMMPILVLAISDIIVPWYVFDTKQQKMRYSYGIYIINSIYLFMPIYILHAVIMALLVSICYLISIALYSYVGDSAFFEMTLISEIIFFLSINFFGLYFRLLREIAIIEVFYDRWELIKQTVMFKYQRDQEKSLLLSIIPANTAEDLVADIMNRIRKMHKHRDGGETVDNFNIKPDKLYIYFYNNVTILYADIVNFTYLTTTLEVKPLVQTLHELYVKFDEAAVEHNCLRIKFLGDCYYCVSGIPEQNDRHAKSCVELGLNMIRIIREIRTRRKLNIDMRIGIHSGNVFAGIIGLTKWQYDIWSKDVEIANKLESTGVPGRVHVSKTTLEKLDDEFYFEQGPSGAKEDDFLIENGIKETYLIIPRAEYIYRKSKKGSGDSYHINTNFLSTTTFLYQTIRQEALKEVEKQYKIIRGSTSAVNPKYWLKRGLLGERDKDFRITRVFLIMKNVKTEYQFWNEPDILLKYTCLTAMLLFLGIALIIGINNPINESYSVQVVIGCGILLFWISLLWYKKIWTYIWRDTSDLDTVLVRRNIVSEFLYTSNDIIIRSIFWRLFIYLLVVFSNFLCAFLALRECKIYEPGGHTLEERTRLEAKYAVCVNSWYITDSIILARCVNFLFVQIPFLCKFIVDVIVGSIYGWFLFVEYSYVFEHSVSSTYGLVEKYAHLYVLVVNFILFNLMERQTEFFFKTDYNWKQKLVTTKKEIEISRATSKLLIENILPQHIAEIYMTRQMKDELYTEKYNNVAVMFATIRNYDIDVLGLPVLDKIICDFDEKLIAYSGVLKIEKIKVIGLTYMAACGLNPGVNRDAMRSEKKKYDVSKWTKVRRSMVNNELVNEIYEKHPFLNVLMMTEFALELMNTLHKFNTDYFNVYRTNKQVYALRIGISHGEVMAGIVGSSKPSYDIWGNTVNMASRMDTTGTEGQIQVTEETALVLQSLDINCDYRGKTFVKGINYIPTYFVGIDEYFKFVPIKKELKTDRYENIYTQLSRFVKTLNAKQKSNNAETKKSDSKEKR